MKPPPESIDAEAGQALRSNIIRQIERPVNDFFSPWVTSNATGHRKGTDARGFGPGIHINSEIINFAIQNGFGVPMTGMVFATGDWKAYMARLDNEICEMLGKKCAKVLIVLQSNALFISYPCLDEIIAALDNKMKGILIRCDDVLLSKSKWWPLPNNQKNDIERSIAFMQKRKRVIGFLASQNTIPPPGETILTSHSAPGIFLDALDTALKEKGIVITSVQRK
eukprot:CAMPEP_0171308034 /NCGR_PEP_ID=MMETSP0816-20121228/18131_1 /TAXON_ID=420281 /ORGANISM="Proboscia inermis, Strain CCAP1064/1" /LENGTH=223 /DNA_ID=CAMNT_0011790651 /DNA_START=123 /DNA_END=794 /DNA_ORIENTATION=+